jgi:poly-gamma-glutamate synthesis protein (capsule biosynthesis protein)
MRKIHKNICFILLLGFISLAGHSQDTISVDTLHISDEVPEEPSDSLKPITALDTNKLVLLFAGDIMGHDTQIVGAYNEQTKSYNYEPVFRYIRDYLSDADIAIGNLEVTLAGPPYKGYPQFSSPDELAIETKAAGFDMLVTANNHALDRGKEGFERTLHILDSLEFVRAGTYLDSLERDSIYPVILEKNGIRIAILNYTYGTNGLKVDPPLIVNRIDTAQISTDLKKARSANPDYTIVFIHWGKEYERTENTTQVKLAYHMLENGADAIIGSHPHVVQPIRILKLEGDSIKTYPVVYSLGNFVSNQRAQYKDGGIIAELHLSKIGENLHLDSLLYLPYWVWRQDHANGKSTFYVVPIGAYEADPSQFEFTERDIYRLERFASDTRSHLKEARESTFYRKEKGLSQKSKIF